MMIVDREKLNQYWRTYEATRFKWWQDSGLEGEAARSLRAQLRIAKQKLFQARAEMEASPSGRAGRAVVTQLAQDVLEWEQELTEDRMTEDERTWLKQWEEAGGWR